MLTGANKLAKHAGKKTEAALAYCELISKLLIKGETKTGLKASGGILALQRGPKISHVYALTLRYTRG